MCKKVRIFCDVDDTLWDLLPAWVEYYNATHDEQVNTDVQYYDNWSFEGKVPDVDEFMKCLDSPNLWKLVNVPRERIDTLRWVNDLFNVELYIVTSAKPKHIEPKIKRFLEFFPFIKESQIITCHDKWVLDGDIWIDDKPETLEKCYKKGNTIKVYRPYNISTEANIHVIDFSQLYFDSYYKTKFKNMVDKIYMQNNYCKFS